MKILDRETYVKHRTNYRIINSLLMVIRLVSVIFITALFILAIIFSLVGESFEEKYNNISEVLRWLIYVSVAIWIVIKVIVVYYKRNLQRAKNKIYDIVDEV